MQIDLKSQKWLAIWMISILVFQTVIGFSTFPSLSFITTTLSIISIPNFLLMAYLYCRQAQVNMLEVLSFVFLTLFITSTFISGTYMGGAIHRCTELLTYLMTISYYKHYLPTILKTLAVTFSVCVYLNGLVMVAFPDMMLSADNMFDSFLLGGNYNQMGGRMLPAILFNCMCLPYSKKWIFNIIPLVFVSIGTLAIVGSMTSLTSIILFCIFCLIPNIRLCKYALYSTLIMVLLFQCLVVFSGNSLHDYEFIRYFVEDILQKDMTFTYRTYLWDAAGKAFSQSPLIGYGNVDADWYFIHVNAAAIGPHNFIYNILLQGGILLLLTLSAIICLCARSAMQSESRMVMILGMSIAALFTMMLMEVYPFLFLFMLLTLMYYFPTLYTKETIKPLQDSILCQK